MSRIPDLVRDSKLETRFHAKYVCHRYLESGFAPQERAVAREEYWKRVKHIGGGSFGSVWLEKCIKGGRDQDLRAVKDISRSSSWNKKIDYTRELEAMAKFSHPKYVRCFVRSLGWYENADVLSIAMEYFPDGDLHQYLHSSPPLAEVEAQHIVYQIAEGLAFLHENGFAHRDLKPNNILVKSKPPDGSWWVKIGDFGISKRAEDGTAALSTLKGTLAFMSPELHGLVDPSSCFPHDSLAALCAADMWSLGEITYQVLTKESAFQNLGKLLAYVQQPEIFPSSALENQNVTPTGISLVRDLMRAEPIHRTRVEEILRHSWTQVCRPISSKPPSIVSLTLSETADDALASHLNSMPEPSGRWSPVSNVMEDLDQAFQDKLTIDHSLSADGTLLAPAASSSYMNRKVVRNYVEASEVNYEGNDWSEEEEAACPAPSTKDDEKLAKAEVFRLDWRAPQRPPKIPSQSNPEFQQLPAEKGQTRVGVSTTPQDYRQKLPDRTAITTHTRPQVKRKSSKFESSDLPELATLHDTMKFLSLSEDTKVARSPSFAPPTASPITADPHHEASRMRKASKNDVDRKALAATRAASAEAQENDEQITLRMSTLVMPQKIYAKQQRQSEKAAEKPNDQNLAALGGQSALSVEEKLKYHDEIGNLRDPLEAQKPLKEKRPPLPGWLIEGLSSRSGLHADLWVSVPLRFIEESHLPGKYRYKTSGLQLSVYLAITQVPGAYRELWHSPARGGCIPINITSANFGSQDTWSALRSILLASAYLQSRLDSDPSAKQVIVTLTTKDMDHITRRRFAEIGLLTVWLRWEKKARPISYDNVHTAKERRERFFNNGYNFHLRQNGRPVIARIYKFKIWKLWHEDVKTEILPSSVEFVVCEYIAQNIAPEVVAELTEVFESSMPYGDKAILHNFDKWIPTVSQESLYRQWNENSKDKLTYRPPTFVAQTVSSTNPKIATAPTSMSRMDKFLCKIGGVPLPPSV